MTHNLSTTLLPPLSPRSQSRANEEAAKKKITGSSVVNYGASTDAVQPHYAPLSSSDDVTGLDILSYKPPTDRQIGRAVDSALNSAIANGTEDEKQDLEANRDVVRRTCCDAVKNFIKVNGPSLSSVGCGSGVGAGASLYLYQDIDIIVAVIFGALMFAGPMLAGYCNEGFAAEKKGGVVRNDPFKPQGATNPFTRFIFSKNVAMYTVLTFHAVAEALKTLKSAQLLKMNAAGKWPYAIAVFLRELLAKSIPVGLEHAEANEVGIQRHVGALIKGLTYTEPLIAQVAVELDYMAGIIAVANVVDYIYWGETSLQKLPLALTIVDVPTGIDEPISWLGYLIGGFVASPIPQFTKGFDINERLEGGIEKILDALGTRNPHVRAFIETIFSVSAILVGYLSGGPMIAELILFSVVL